jgi:Hen1-like subunit of RNA repair complex
VLLTLRTTRAPATDLSLLLQKPSGGVESLDLPFGKAYVFYPEAEETSCAAALLLDIPAAIPFERVYTSSSLLAVAIASLFAPAMEERTPPIPLEARIAALPCREGESLVRRLFEPLGYRVAVEVQPLDPAFPEWGPSPYAGVTLRAVCPPGDLLRHLSVLIPVFEEGDLPGGARDLLQYGLGWLADHPERELISRRFSRGPER